MRVGVVFPGDRCERGLVVQNLVDELNHLRTSPRTIRHLDLRGIDPMERLAPIAARKPPMTVIPSVYQAATPSPSSDKR